MKKQIISLLLLISLSFQSTYPAFEGVKGSIEKAKKLLNVRKNIRCLRKGDNCTKAKRAQLGAISVLVAALVAAGVVAGGKRALGETLSPEHKELWDNIKSVTSPKDFEIIKFNEKMASDSSLKDIRFQGFSLIGAFLKGRFEEVISHPTDIVMDISGLIKVVDALAEDGVQVTRKDWLLANDLAGKLIRRYPTAIRLYRAVDDLYRAESP
ncbi:hypothetical protein E3J61_02565 [Candidatus Dependentiae bacterium]|nr:MAG: hypothetical protein E3J61_02565 [Candidatus Dependentiae bacterium]